jgi:hypothetical protein
MQIRREERRASEGLGVSGKVKWVDELTSWGWGWWCRRPKRAGGRKEWGEGHARARTRARGCPVLAWPPGLVRGTRYEVRKVSSPDSSRRDSGARGSERQTHADLLSLLSLRETASGLGGAESGR